MGGPGAGEHAGSSGDESQHDPVEQRKWSEHRVAPFVGESGRRRCLHRAAAARGNQGVRTTPCGAAPASPGWCRCRRDRGCGARRPAAHPASVRNVRCTSSSATSQVTARVNRSAAIVSAAACSSRDPCPRPRSAASTVSSMSSPSVTWSQSGSVAGVVIAKPTTRLRSRATRARCRASAGWVNASRQSCAKSAVRRSPAAGTSPAYDVAQARAWISAIASASSAQAIRTETSAVGLLMAPILAAAGVLHPRGNDAQKCHKRW